MGGARSRPARILVDDVEVRDAILALDEVAVVLGIEYRALELPAGEFADRVERVPERDEHELGAIAFDASQCDRAAVSGDAPILGVPRAIEILQIRLGVIRARRTAPHPRDHTPPLTPV